MEIAESVGTELALSGLSRVVNKLASHFGGKLASHFGGDVTPEEMEHLNAFVGYEIEALIRQTESKDLVKSAPLLEKLQAAALELDDLLDLYQYNQIEKQVISSSSSNPIKKLKPIFKEGLRPILPKSILRIGLEKLLKFVEQVEKLHPFITSRTVTTQPQADYHVTPKTSTLSTPFYGRADQCEMIIKLLLDESHADLNSRTRYVPIIAITGMEGAGKTTTAQHIYNENRIKNYFDLRMWVHVTSAFDERSLIKETIECAEGKTCDQITNLDILQKILKDSVSKKRFLLVLDDVLEKDTARLDLLLAPLNQVGEKGSRIILTTRMEKVAEDLHAKPIIDLDDLKDEDCWSILKYYAFDDDEEILENDPELKNVGNQIIKKAKRSPLALKVVGSSLRNKRNIREWDKILRQKDILKKTMNLLLISYQCLPLHLQRCFAYCSLFPKGYKFLLYVFPWRPCLISLWIAQGFIESKNESTLEEEGQKYIEELMSFSFFEKKSEDHFVIHDLLHELAEIVSKKQCHRIEYNDSLNAPTTCIHLSLCMRERIDQSTILAISNMSNLKNLHSLIILEGVHFVNIFESKKDIFQNLTKLRALYVSSEQMEILHYPHIDKLKHLRFLHVPHNSKLPMPLVRLYHLQFLILNMDQEYSTRLLPAKTLPRGFSNLTNLRALRFYDKRGDELDYLYYNSEMVNIEKLTLLQNLDKFHVDGFNGMRSLGRLTICGSLSILNLENVKGKKEAEEAKLNQKKNIDTLIFVWSNTSSGIDTCEEVLEGLEPHRNLQSLEINGYQGAKSPKWMVEENRLPCLRTLRLEFCTSLEIVPLLPPSLEWLKVKNCHELMQLPPDPLPSLKWLKVENCHKLKQLPPLPSLEQLKIRNCHELMQLPPLPSLQGLVVENCHELMQLPLISDTVFNLRVIRCPKLQAFTNLSPTVTFLTIEDCPKLTSLGNLPPCASLEELVIRKCPMLRIEEASLVEAVAEGDTAYRRPHVDEIKTDDPLLVLELVQQQVISSSTGLILTDCAAVPNLEMLSSLGRLHIRDCPDVESLPNLPVSLQELWIESCPKLKEKYEEGGPLRNTISHIPIISIR